MRIRIEPDGARALTFVDNPIPRSTYNRFARVCLETMTFLPIDANDIRQLMIRARLMPHNGDWNDAALDIFQAQSIRRNVTHQYLISRSYIVKNSIDNITREYDAGASALDIAHKLKHSPYFVFRHIIAPKVGKEKLDQISLGTVRAEDVLSERDAREYMSVREYDYESVGVHAQIARMADEREARFIDILRECGINLMTQSELYARAMADDVQPITPDALFLSPVTVNGVDTKWIDFKSYFGAPIPYLLRNTAAQVAKYDIAYGPGFIAYEQGYVTGLPYASVSARGMRDKIEETVIPGVL